MAIPEGKLWQFPKEGRGNSRQKAVAIRDRKPWQFSTESRGNSRQKGVEIPGESVAVARYSESDERKNSIRR